MLIYRVISTLPQVLHNMAAFLRRTLERFLGLAAPMRFPTSGYELVSSSVVLDEEMFDDYSTERYYPVNIGDVFASRYQVLGKLGFGSSSTVWLGRDLRFDTFVLSKKRFAFPSSPEPINTSH